MIFIICFLNEFTFHNTQGWSLQAPIYLYFYATYIQSIWKGQNIKQLQTISTVCTMFVSHLKGMYGTLLVIRTNGETDRVHCLALLIQPIQSLWFLVIKAVIQTAV